MKQLFGVAFAAAAVAAATVVVLAQPPAPAAAPAPVTPDAYRALRFRYIGPVGNRTDAVAGVPGDPWTYYAGAASGGIWKTSDGGVHWQPIFDDQPVSSIGALAVAPSDRSIVWAGTGEAFIRSHISMGIGIYKSTDAGRTWTHMGLDKTARIGRILIDPRNPDIVFACSLGHAYAPQPDRGVFRTTDGGKTWTRILFVDENTGCSDIAMDPSSARVLYAGMWQLDIKTWTRTSGGPGSGLFKSTDGGTTWRKLNGRGLPAPPIGKVTVAVAPSNPERVYAQIETGDGEPWNAQPANRGHLWRSNNGGESWELVSYDRQLGGRTHYYNRHVVNPADENELYFLSASFSKTFDGGKTTEDVAFAASPGGDNHDMWIDPNGDRMIVANDQGVSISVNRGRTWQRIQLPLGQMYHVTVDNQVPYFVYGNRQDGPSTRGPSNSLYGGFGGGGIPRGEWHSIAGGESGFATPDPVDPDIIWSSGTGSGSIGGVVTRFEEKNRQARDVEVWPETTVGAPAGEVKYRFNWEFPVTISPHDHNRVYVGSQHVHVTTDGGQSWQELSPDLTRNDRSRMGPSGGLTTDNIGVEYAGVVFAIAESPKEKGLIWAGTNDGLVHVTRDNGQTWTNVTASIPALPPWVTISNIEASRYDAGTAYLTAEGHQIGNFDPFVYVTRDYGRTWKAITGGLPKGTLAFAHCVREDPKRRGLLYLGTESALYVSFNDGESWQPLQTNLPHAPVYWMVVQDPFNDLVVATYGRGFWILDDITPLQKLTPEVAGAAATLFAPRDAWRFRNREQPFSESDDPTAGQNPPYGATINFFVKSAPPNADGRITIQDTAGAVIRSIRGPVQPGLNRVVWDLRTDPTRAIVLQTSPVGAPDVHVGPDGTRPYPGGGFGGGGRLSMLVPPGTYTVKLALGDHEFAQKLTVKKDPHSSGIEADIAAQAALLRAVSDDLNSIADAINQLESLRAQLATIVRVVVPPGSGADQGVRAVRTAADDLEKTLIAVEDPLFQMKVTGRGQDLFRFPPRLVEKLTHLAQSVASSDFAPTTQAVAVQAQLKQAAAKARADVSGVIAKDVAAFNAVLKERGIAGGLIAGAARASTNNNP